jgi:hypothetical protein
MAGVLKDVASWLREQPREVGDYLSLMLWGLASAEVAGDDVPLGDTPGAALADRLERLSLGKKREVGVGFELRTLFAHFMARKAPPWDTSLYTTVIQEEPRVAERMKALLAEFPARQELWQKSIDSWGEFSKKALSDQALGLLLDKAFDERVAARKVR